MLDNLLLKLGFKGHDGKARPGNLDASGNLKVKVEDTDPVKVQVSGNIPEYQWLSTDTPPVLGATDRAFGVEMDTTTHEMTIYYWTGSDWAVKS